MVRTDIDNSSTLLDLRGAVKPPSVVYIPTLSRPNNLRKIIPYWIEQDISVRLVVERSEYAMHNRLRQSEGWGRDVYVLPLPLSSRGIGYSRNYCVRHAQRTHLDSIIMSDDDIYVHPDSDAGLLLDEAEDPRVLGVGGKVSFHDLFTGGAISKMSGLILCPGGWAHKLYGLNVQNAINCGNYNKSLTSCGDDDEIQRQGISRGFPWLIHCDVKCVSIGKRRDPGGVAAKYKTDEQFAESERECAAVIHKIWPDYTNPPGKKWRVAWQKMLDDYMPNWREASALHGGSLENLWRTSDLRIGRENARVPQDNFPAEWRNQVSGIDIPAAEDGAANPPVTRNRRQR